MEKISSKKIDSSSVEFLSKTSKLLRNRKPAEMDPLIFDSINGGIMSAVDCIVAESKLAGTEAKFTELRKLLLERDRKQSDKQRELAALDTLVFSAAGIEKTGRPARPRLSESEFKTLCGVKSK
jgi:hypothetical protein